MKSYMKSVQHTLENKNVALPLYALLGTSAVFLVRHFLFNKDRSGHDNFRAGAAQFDNKQLGTMEQTPTAPDAENYSENSSALQTDSSDTGIKSISEETISPETHSLAVSETENTIQQDELPAYDVEIPSESTLIETISEVIAPEAGEKEQCKAITKKGTRCRNKADSSGYCFQHRT